MIFAQRTFILLAFSFFHLLLLLKSVERNEDGQDVFLFVGIKSLLFVQGGRTAV